MSLCLCFLDTYSTITVSLQYVCFILQACIKLIKSERNNFTLLQKVIMVSTKMIKQ